MLNNNNSNSNNNHNDSTGEDTNFKKLNSGDASVYVSNNDGYGETLTGEAGSDRNITSNNDNLLQTSATDTQEQFGLEGNAASMNDYNDNYDPAQYENYYYQDEDGNYYYYTDPQEQQQQEEEQQQQEHTQEEQQQEMQHQQMLQFNDPNMTMNYNNNNIIIGSNSNTSNLGLPGGFMIGPDGRLVPSTVNNLLRLHEFDNWEPQHYNWFADIVVDTFVNIVYKAYLTILLYCAGVFIAIMGLDYTFASLYRIFVPPDPTRNVPLQVLCYSNIFCYLSFVIVSALCVLIDMLHNLWNVRREDRVFWGMSHKSFTKSKPPYWIYFCIILTTVLLPILWGIIDAAVNHQSVLFVAQRYANVAVLATTFMVLICYVELYWRALQEKYYAIKHRKTEDEFALRAKAYRHKPHKMNKTHWYHASHVLEEFGVDGTTLRHNCVVFTIACVPIFALYAAQSVRTYNGDPSVIYALIACIALMCVYLLAWLSIFHLKGQWSVYCAFVLIALFVILGAAGAGASGVGVGVGVVVVLFVACQGSLTRKRTHNPTRKELCTLLNIPFVPKEATAALSLSNTHANVAGGVNSAMHLSGNGGKSEKDGLLKRFMHKHHDEEVNANTTASVNMLAANANLSHSMMPNWHEMRVDTYLCCCHEVLLNYLRCFNVKRIFGYTHPEVKRARQLYAEQHIALRTDQKVLFVWWIVVLIAVAFTVGLGNGIMYRFSQPIATAEDNNTVNVMAQESAQQTTQLTITANNNNNNSITNNSDISITAVCELEFNKAGMTPLKVYDLALLSALSYTYGENGNVDFATWFRHSPTLVRIYPLRLPTSFNNATHNITVPFSDYVDVNSGFHVITLNSNTRGMALFRDVDEWGESMAFQAAASVSPLMMIWPERYRAAFVQSAALFKKWFPASYALDEVRNYTNKLLVQGTKPSQVLLVGDQFNGGYAKLLASELNLTFVAFNPPGVKYKVTSIMDQEPLNGVQLSAIRGLWSYIDSLEDTANTVYMPCPRNYSSNLCGRITTTIDYLYHTCGDEYNRHVTSTTS